MWQPQSLAAEGPEDRLAFTPGFSCPLLFGLGKVLASLGLAVLICLVGSFMWVGAVDMICLDSVSIGISHRSSDYWLLVKIPRSSPRCSTFHIPHLLQPHWPTALT